MFVRSAIKRSDSDDDRELKPKSSPFDVLKDALQGESAAVIIVALLASGLLVSLLGNFVLILNNRGLARRESVYVQTPSGSTIAAQEFDQLHREAATIKNTVARWTQLTFEWDAAIPGSETIDTGIDFQGTMIPTTAYLASYLMESGFRTEFLRAYGRDVVPRSVFRGNLQSTVIFYSISDPRQVGEGRWEVDVVSTRMEVSDGEEEREVDFNRTFTVEAIPPVSPVLEETPDAFKRQIYALLRNGLAIVAIEPLDISN